MEEMYPEKEAHLAEEDRQGAIPPDVWKAIQACITKPPGLAQTGIPQKHATPAEAPDNIDAILE